MVSLERKAALCSEEIDYYQYETDSPLLHLGLLTLAIASRSIQNFVVCVPVCVHDSRHDLEDVNLDLETS